MTYNSRPYPAPSKVATMIERPLAKNAKMKAYTSDKMACWMIAAIVTDRSKVSGGGSTTFPWLTAAIIRAGTQGLTPRAKRATSISSTK